MDQSSSCLPGIYCFPCCGLPYSSDLVVTDVFLIEAEEVFLLEAGPEALGPGESLRVVHHVPGYVANYGVAGHHALVDGVMLELLPHHVQLEMLLDRGPVFLDHTLETGLTFSAGPRDHDPDLFGGQELAFRLGLHFEDSRLGLEKG